MLTGGVSEALVALLTGLLLDAWLGEPAWLWRRIRHPVIAVGGLIEQLEHWLLDPSKSISNKYLTGIALALVLVTGTIAGGLSLELMLHLAPGGWLLSGCIIFTLLAWRSLEQHVAAVATGLERDLAAGQAAVANIVGRDPAALDEHGVARAAIESLAENFSDGVVAPAFWALLFGLPGILAYKAVNTADSMIGHRSARYRQFGWATARLDDLLNLAPARLSGLLIAISAALIRGCDPKAALVAMGRDAPRHRSPNAGWPEAAAAGALGLALAGPRRYGGAVVEDAWMGDGRAAADGNDIRRALALVRLAHGLLVAGLSVTLGCVLLRQ